MNAKHNVVTWREFIRRNELEAGFEHGDLELRADAKQRRATLADREQDPTTPPRAMR